MLLSELLQKLGKPEVLNYCDCDIKNVYCDSRECTSDSVFFALKGLRSSVESNVNDAVKNGASAVFFDEEDLHISLNYKNTIKIKNVRKVMAECAKTVYGNGIEDMQIIGVTGTKGKSGTVLCLQSILNEAGILSISVGTLGAKVGNAPMIRVSANTTPDSSTLWRLLRDARLIDAKVAILEISSQALATYRVYGIPFSAGVFTNFSEDHIGAGEHSTIDEYFSVKRSFFTDYGIRLAILNANSSYSLNIAPADVERILAFSRIVGKTNSLSTLFVTDGELYNVFGGGYNAENAALAIVTAKRLFQVPEYAIMNGLEKYRPEGRFEVYSIYGKRVIIDYAHNPESIRAVLTEARSFTVGRIIAVFGSVGMRSVGRRVGIAAVCEALADLSVITADNPDFEPVSKISSEIYASFKNKRRAKMIDDRIEAIAFAVSAASSGDTVLLLGKGHERHQLIYGERRVFSERAVLLALGAVRA